MAERRSWRCAGVSAGKRSQLDGVGRSAPSAFFAESAARAGIASPAKVQHDHRRPETASDRLYGGTKMIPFQPSSS